MIDNNKVGKIIATLRQDRGMTQQQLAAALSVSHQAVSKWENGAALPDIETMMELTHLFGITVEQLVSGELPVDEPEKKNSKTIDEHIQSFGKFVTNVVDGFRRPVQKDAEAMAEEAEEPVHGPEEEAEPCSEKEASRAEGEFDVRKILKMAPFMSKSALDSFLTDNKDALSADDIERLAPFISRGTLDMLLLNNRDKFSPDDIARLAPFLSKGTLEKLIFSSEEGIDWDTLQKLAPFLKREMVDVLTKAAAKGEKIVHKAFGVGDNTTTDFEKSLENVSRKITAGVEKMARHAQKFGEEIVEGFSAAFGDQPQERAKTNRSRTLRLAALERAMQDDRWDWIAARLSDIQDESVRASVAQTAIDHGMSEWVKTNLPEYAEINDAEAALENGDWEKVSTMLGSMDREYLARAALKAASECRWTWLSENADRLEFGENATRIARLAYESNMRDTVIAFAETKMDEAEIEDLITHMIQRGDYGFAGHLSHLVGSAFLENICTNLACEGKWTCTEEFLPLVEEEGIERLMELAISQGDFTAIDILDKYLE